MVYVEDDTLSREVMSVLVRKAFPGAFLTIMPDSAAFIDRVESLPVQPGLFLLDVHVQPIDGFEMLGLLRRRPAYADAKIIAVTASVMNQEIVQLRSAGFDGAIGKPLDFDHFASLIERILRGDEVWDVI